MGGAKKGQRTKGNARPSSSGRSAQLLSASGAGLSGFVGFGGLAGDCPAYVPPTGQQASDDVDANVDSDFRMVMRKLTKRDQTTRLKALQELTDLVKEKDVELVKGALPFWPRLYNKLALDNDRRVREATHRAHEQLCLKVKRGLAPHAKAMVGAWLAGQCDPFAPAASAAKAAFAAAFPSAKQAQVLSFFSQELFSYFSDMILVQTPATMPDSRGLRKEEQEAKFFRCLSCSLFGLKLLVDSLSPLPEPNCLESLLGDGKFWKLAKHADVSVRKSWYGLMASVCQKIPDLALKHAKQVSSITLSSLAETDPLVAVPVWETALALLSSIPDCWDHVNARKAVLPQLWRVLKGGGFGSATHIYPNLLPFLSLVPADVVGEGVGFYEAFFNSMREGLSDPRVQNTPSECNAVVQAFMECLRYVLTRNLDAGDENSSAVRKYLLTEQLHTLLESSLKDPKSRLSTSSLYRSVAELHSYFLRQSISDTVDSTKKTSFEHMLTHMWDNLSRAGLEILANDTLDGKSVQRFCSLVSEVHQPSPPKMRRRVTIADPSNEEPSLSSKLLRSSSCSTIPVPTSVVQGRPDLMHYTAKLCCVVFEHAKTSGHVAYVEALSALLRAACSEVLLCDLLKDVDEASRNGTASRFLRELCPLLGAEIDDESERGQFCSHVVDCFVTVSFLADADEVVEFFDDVTQGSRLVLAIVVEKSLACWESHHGVKKWLQGTKLSQALVGLAAELIPTSSEHGDAELIWRILRAALGTANMPVPVISLSTLGAILSTIQQSLQEFANVGSDNEGNLWKAVDFVCDVTLTLFSSYQGCSHLSSSEDLLLTLFLLNCQNATSSAPSGSMEKVSRAWQQGVHMIVKAQGGFLKDDGVLRNISSKIHSLALSDMTAEKRCLLTECSSEFLSCIYSALPEGEQSSAVSNPTIAAILDIALPTQEEWESLMKEHSLLERLALHLKDRKRSPYFKASVYTKHATPSSANELRFKEVAQFVEHVFDCLLTLRGEMPGDEDEGSSASTEGEEDSAQVLCCAQFLLVAKCLGSSSAAAHEDKDDEHLALTSFMRGHARSLFYNMVGRVLSGENLWLEALNFFLREVLTKQDASEICLAYYESVKDNLCEAQETTLVIQILLPYLLEAHKQETFSQCMNHLVCWDPAQGCSRAAELLVLLAKAVEAVDKVPAADVVSVLFFLQGIRGTHPDLYLRNDSEKLSDEEREFSAACCLFLSTVVSRCPEALVPLSWDFVLLSVAMWTEKFSWKRSIRCFSVDEMVFACDLFSLLLGIRAVIDGDSSVREDCSLPETVSVEWKEFYTETIFAAVLPGFIEMTDAPGTLNEIEELLMSRLSAALALASEKQVLKFTGCSSDDLTSLLAITTRLLPLMTSKSCAVQIGGNVLLQKIVPSVAKLDAEQLAKDDEEQTSRPPPEPLLSKLRETEHVVDALLSDFDVGDCCIVQPQTDSYTYTLGYLLCWSQLLSFFGASPAEARSEYATFLQEMGFLANLLKHLFCLMPENINLASATASSPSKGKTMFTEAVTFIPGEDFTSLKLQHMACQVYLDTISKLPALVRNWWNSQNKRIIDHVERFTSRHVSGVISSKELQAVQKAEVAFKNMTVKARPVAREVVATHTIEEVAMELVVRLPANHPLGPVTIESGRRVGVGNNQWRHWLLQLTTFLTHQNGSILDGLALWKRNIDKRFEGVEECMICFYVLHGATCQLPTLTCRICKKRFHSACLFKWFSTSNNSTCPLCRNVF